MKFLVPINEVKDQGSQTCDVVDTGSDNAKVNKRKLREYFRARGVPATHIKRVMKAMGFWGSTLGASS